jgi:hypothetical protein
LYVRNRLNINIFAKIDKYSNLCWDLTPEILLYWYREFNMNPLKK